MRAGQPERADSANPVQKRHLVQRGARERDAAQRLVHASAARLLVQPEVQVHGTAADGTCS